MTGRGEDALQQPGYDQLAVAYDAAFPQAYHYAEEQHAVALFAEQVLAGGHGGPVVDVGCGTGHVAADLARRGLDVVGVDPSGPMLDIARRTYPEQHWFEDDARLGALPTSDPLAGVVARFSLIHVEPQDVAPILTAWAHRVVAGGPVLVAFQCSDSASSPVLEFDHKVARAWRWHPDAMSAALRDAGFSERWRLIAAADHVHRFAECHLLAVKAE